PYGFALASRAVAVQSLRLTTVSEQARSGTRGARRLRGAATTLDDRLRLGQQHRQALPSAGRDRHALLHHDRFSKPGGQQSHHPRPRQHGSIAVRARTDRRTPRLAGFTPGLLSLDVYRGGYGDQRWLLRARKAPLPGRRGRGVLSRGAIWR